MKTLPDFEVELYDDGRIFVDLIAKSHSSLVEDDVKLVAKLSGCGFEPCLPHEEGDNCYWLEPSHELHMRSCELVSMQVRNILQIVMDFRDLVWRAEELKRLEISDD